MHARYCMSSLLQHGNYHALIICLYFFQCDCFITLKVNYKGSLVYEILMDSVARKRIQKLHPIILNGFQDIAVYIFTSYLINIYEFIYDIIVEH